MVASEHFDSTDALLASTAQALRVWRRLQLEIGEAAVFTGVGPLAEAVGLVALWRGGLPVIRLTDAAGCDNVETIDINDAPAALSRLRELTASAPGVAAVDLSGHGEMIAFLLEAMPRWGRVM